MVFCFVFRMFALIPAYDARSDESDTQKMNNLRCYYHIITATKNPLCHLLRQLHLIHHSEFWCQVFLWLSSKMLIRKDMPGPEEVIKKPTVPRPIDDVRFDGMGHLPNIVEKGRCCLCKTGYSTMACMKCNNRLFWPESETVFTIFM